MWHVQLLSSLETHYVGLKTVYTFHARTKFPEHSENDNAVVPLYPLIWYLWFTAAKKKIGKLKK
jgi:hypothetical protein